jgi:hypothetical protein
MAQSKPMEGAMMLAIENLVRTFEKLLLEAPLRKGAPLLPAANDNGEMDDDERRYAAYR